MRRAGGGTTWTSGGAGGGAKQKGENDGAVRIRTKGSAVEVTIIDKAEQRKQEMREAEAESKRRATRIIRVEQRKRGKKKNAMRAAKATANEVVRKVANTLKDKRKELSDRLHNATLGRGGAAPEDPAGQTGWTAYSGSSGRSIKLSAMHQASADGVE